MSGRDRQGKYAYLEQLSTSDLEAILRADAELQGNGDDDMILTILEVIEKREKEQPTGHTPNVKEAWARFQTIYNVPEGDDLSLYPMDESECPTDGPDNCVDTAVVDGNIKAVSTDTAVSKPRTRGRTRWKIVSRRIIPVAATIAVLMLGMITAQAAGLDIFGALAQWTDETFRFVSSQDRELTPPPTPSTEPGSANSQELHDAFQAALDQCGITEPLAPTWFPEGCEMDGEPDVSSNELMGKISLKYSISDSQYFIITVQRYYSEIFPDIMGTEKDDGTVEQYVSHSRLFYIMTNNTTLGAAWSDGQALSIKITGEISTETLKQLIDSIGA